MNLYFYQNDAVLAKIGKFTKKSEFTPESIGKVSSACKGLCLWVRCNINFFNSFVITCKTIVQKISL
jgi:hypothetical protein